MCTSIYILTGWCSGSCLCDLAGDALAPELPLLCIYIIPSMCTYIHTCVYIYIHIHTYTQMCLYGY